MVDREILATRLSKLRSALVKLERIAEQARDDYLTNETDRALAEHYLRIALEATLDAGNHVIAAEGFRKPLKLRDVPLILAENRVIPTELAEKLARAVGLRNRLVHGYAEIDHERLHEILNEELIDLERFAVAIGSRYTDPE
ncbi:MAG TPA: DUF86 domain-containing protein [Vicinamibacteria bacterium]|nr:DUF86 domain-containing protein [Vicinamibacteria bacterium]